MRISKNFLLSEINRIIEPTLEIRRYELENTHGIGTKLGVPPTLDELEDFLLQCPFTDVSIRDFLLGSAPENSEIELSKSRLDTFYEDVQTWSENFHWLGADDTFIVAQKIILESHSEYSFQELQYSPVVDKLALYSPSITVLQRLFRQQARLDNITWRQLEELIAELLDDEGYEVKLGRGTKDDGADIVAFKNLPGMGPIKTVWQAKHHPSGNKVGISLIRELADVRNELGASKAIMVTTSYLTSGALDRVERDKYTLGKIERDELENWISHRLEGRPYLP